MSEPRESRPRRRALRVGGAVLAVIVLAAGLLSNGLMELHESALIPTLGERPWDTDAYLSMTSTLGRLAHTLLGYDSAPTWGQVVAYWTYLLGGIAALAPPAFGDGLHDEAYVNVRFAATRYAV